MQSPASAKQRSEFIRAAMRSASGAPDSHPQPPDLLVHNERQSPRRNEHLRYPKLTTGFQYSVVLGRPAQLQPPPSRSSDIGLRVPSRPQSARPDPSLNLGVGTPGDDCIVASSPRILVARSNAGSPRADSRVVGDEFARASNSPSSQDKIKSSLQQALVEAGGESGQEQIKRPSTASNRRAPTTPRTQARPSTANANPDPSPLTTLSPRKVSAGSGSRTRAPSRPSSSSLSVAGVAESDVTREFISPGVQLFSADIPTEQDLEGDNEPHSRFVPVEQRRLHSAKIRAEARQKVLNVKLLMLVHEVLMLVHVFELV